MSGVGPYYSTGDAGHGGQYSPNDGERALNMANDFLADPPASNGFVTPVPMTTSSSEPGRATGQNLTAVTRVMRAAWCYMTLPGHANHMAWRDAVKAHLLWSARHPNHDWANSSYYPDDFAGYAANPIFGISGYMTRQLKARDMLGQDVFTASENAELDKWFYDYANWVFHWWLSRTANKIPNRLSDDFSTTHSAWLIGSGHLAWDASPTGASVEIAGSGGQWTNRHMGFQSIGSGIANYLDFYNITVDTGGTQPSYGWMPLSTMLQESRAIYKSFLHMNLHPQGMTYDFHRAFEGSTADSPQGWRYAAQEILHTAEIAHYHALNGDDSLWGWGTTDGYTTAAGSPNNTPGVGNFPQKNIQYAAWAHARYINDAWGRRVNNPAKGTSDTGGLMVGDRDVHHLQLHAIIGNHFPSDTTIEAAWKRDGEGMPAYPQNPWGNGSFHGYDGVTAFSLGLIEIGDV